MKRTRYKIIFVLIKEILLLSFIIIIGLLSSINNAFDHTKYVSLSNQKCMIQPTLIYHIVMNTVKNFTIVHS